MGKSTEFHSIIERKFRFILIEWSVVASKKVEYYVGYMGAVSFGEGVVAGCGGVKRNENGVLVSKMGRLS